MKVPATRMTVERHDKDSWLVSMEIEMQHGQHFTFAVLHKKARLSIDELERSVIAQARDILGHIVGIGDRTP